MKIDEYYRDTGKDCLNNSILSLIPAALIAIGNLTIFQSSVLMIWVLPFLIHSVLHFQVYMWRIRQSIVIKKNMRGSGFKEDTLFQARHLLVLRDHALAQRLLLFFPDGHLAGEITRFREKTRFSCRPAREFCLYDYHGSLIGIYVVQKRPQKVIEIYSPQKEFIGSFEWRKYSFFREKKELLDPSGRFVGAVEGSTLYMDEHLLDSRGRVTGRLRRGWMPLEWGRLFPDPNTPLFAFDKGLSEQEKLRQFSCLIYEYFIVR